MNPKSENNDEQKSQKTSKIMKKTNLSQNNFVSNEEKTMILKITQSLSSPDYIVKTSKKNANHH